MKIAGVVVGSHFSGKSKTINEHLKPMLGIARRARLFVRNGKSGVVLSQSFEESGRDLNEVVARYAKHDLFVLAARPPQERASRLPQIEAALSKYKFQSFRVPVEPDRPSSYYKVQATRVLKLLDS